MGNRFPLPPTRYPLSPNPYLLLFFSSLRLCVFAPLRFFLPRVFFFLRRHVRSRSGAWNFWCRIRASSVRIRTPLPSTLTPSTSSSLCDS